MGDHEDISLIHGSPRARHEADHVAADKVSCPEGVGITAGKRQQTRVPEVSSNPHRCLAGTFRTCCPAAEGGVCQKFYAGPEILFSHDLFSIPSRWNGLDRLLL